MCNRYLKDATWEEEVAHYKEIDAWRRERMQETPEVWRGSPALSNFANELYPGYKGLVYAAGGFEAMTWGFPRVMTGTKGQKLKPRPVNNTRTENLGSPFWRDSFAKRRCLIPVTSFAEAEGEKGAMTCTWISLPDAPIFSCAGIWRDSPEWGRVYSMMMTEPCEATSCVHDRMPVILRPDDYRQWLGGEPREAIELCKPWDGEVIIERSNKLWSAR